MSDDPETQESENFIFTETNSTSKANIEAQKIVNININSSAPKNEAESVCNRNSEDSVFNSNPTDHQYPSDVLMTVPMNHSNPSSLPTLPISSSPLTPVVEHDTSAIDASDNPETQASKKFNLNNSTSNAHTEGQTTVSNNIHKPVPTNEPESDHNRNSEDSVFNLNPADHQDPSDVLMTVPMNCTYEIHRKESSDDSSIFDFSDHLRKSEDSSDHNQEVGEVIMTQPIFEKVAFEKPKLIKSFNSSNLSRHLQDDFFPESSTNKKLSLSDGEVGYPKTSTPIKANQTNESEYFGICMMPYIDFLFSQK